MAVKHEIRTKNGKTQKVSLTPLTAIRAQCLECVCWQPEEVRLCTSPLCSLFPFRLGKDPDPAKKIQSDLFKMKREAYKYKAKI